MAETEKSLPEIQKQLNNLRGDKNPIIINLEREIERLTRELEETVVILRSATDFRDEEKKTYENAKLVTPQLKTDLTPLKAVKYTELLDLIGSSSVLSDAISDIEESIEKFMNGKKDLIDSYESKIAEADTKIKDLSTKLRPLQDNLKIQKDLRDELNSYIETSQNEDLSKKTAFEFLQKFIDENNNPVFEQAELALAAQMVMFAKNFDLDRANGRSLKDVFDEALKQPGEDLLENQFIPAPDQGETEEIAKIDPKTVEDNPIVPFIEPGTTKNPDDEGQLEEMLNATPVSETPKSRNIAGLDPSFDGFDPYSLINDLEKEEYDTSNTLDIVTNSSITHSDIEQKRFDNNMSYLKSIGIKETENVFKYPVTLYTISEDQLKAVIAEAKLNGAVIKTVADVVKLCSTNNPIDFYRDAIEVNELGDGKPSNVISAGPRFKKIAVSAKKDLLGIMPEIESLLKSLEAGVPVDNNPAAYLTLNNYLMILNDYREGKTYIINGVTIDAERVKQNLEQLIALNLSPEQYSDDQLLLIAIAYNSMLDREKIMKVSSALTPEYSYGGMAA